jgi:hypothetical protein
MNLLVLLGGVLVLAQPVQWEVDEDGEDQPRRMAPHCPWMDPEVIVEVEETASEVAVTFRGPPGKEQELRAFAGRMAAMHGRMMERAGEMERGMGPMRGRMREGMHRDGGMSMMMMRMPAADMRAEEIEGGARLVFTPHDPTDIDALRDHVEMHAEMMSARRCPMMR